MKRTIVITGVVAAAATALTLSACSTSTPVSHADKIACRTVFREQQAITAAHGMPAFAPLAAPEALMAGAAGATQPLKRDLNTAAHQMIYVKNWAASENTTITKALPPLERDCGKLGITAANAEQAN